MTFEREGDEMTFRTAWPIAAGETFQLVFHIHDTSDGILDSEVILDAFHWETGVFEAGTFSGPSPSGWSHD